MGGIVFEPDVRKVDALGSGPGRESSSCHHAMQTRGGAVRRADPRDGGSACEPAVTDHEAGSSHPCNGLLVETGGRGVSDEIEPFDSDVRVRAGISGILIAQHGMFHTRGPLGRTDDLRSLPVADQPRVRGDQDRATDECPAEFRKDEDAAPGESRVDGRRVVGAAVAAHAERADVASFGDRCGDLRRRDRRRQRPARRILPGGRLGHARNRSSEAKKHAPGNPEPAKRTGRHCLSGRYETSRQ